MAEPENLILETLIEFRDEVREFRGETREKLTEHSRQHSLIDARLADHGQRLASIEGRLTWLERHMAALLATVPVMNERIYRPEARLALLEARLP